MAMGITKAAQTAKKLKAALEAFIQSDDFADGIVKSTKSGWGGSGYSVELFEDGLHRVLWDNEIGNRYESPGTILSLPKLDDSDYQDLVVNGDMTEEEWFQLGFENERDEIEKDLRDRMSDRAAMYEQSA
jgi:hypothetical protein